MAKVCLVSLPNPILGSPRMQLPLGVLYIASVLEKHGHDVYISDMRAEHKVNMHLVPAAYDIYAISATTGEYQYAKEVAHYLKSTNKGAVLVIGGPHSTHKPIETLRQTEYDIACIGEGEETMTELAERISKGVDVADFYRIRGIAFKDKNKVIMNEPRALIKHLDTIPFPARHLLPYDHVFTRDLYPGERYGYGDVGTGIITERGCGYRCAYCANWDRNLRLRSIDNVIKEVTECKDDYNCHNFKIIDDEFGVPEARYIELCEALMSLNIKFRAHTRADKVTPDLMVAMKKAGCEELSLGVETPDENILRMVNKKLTYRQCVDAVKMAKQSNLRVKTYLMVCLPGETWESIEKTKQFMLESRPDKWTLSTCIPYPGSDLEKNPEKYGIRILETDYSKYWLYQDESMIETNVASREELNEHRLNLMAWLNNYDKINSKPF